MVKFKVGWVDKEIFKEFIKFSEYKGKLPDGSFEYELKLEKIKKNGLSIEQIMTTLKRANVHLSDNDANELKNMMQNDYDVEIRPTQGNMIVIDPVDFIPELNDKQFKDSFHVWYNWDEKVFYSYPFYRKPIAERLQKYGYKVKLTTPVFKEDLNIEFTGQLRDYQKEAIDVWKKNGNKGIISLPTGAGKTIVGIAGLSQYKKRTLIVVNTIEQMKQWYHSLFKFTNINEEDVGFYHSKEKTIKPITLTTYHTASRHMGDLGDKFGLTIVDEVHHVPANKFKNVLLRNFSDGILGTTATPFREDERTNELYDLTGGVIYSKSEEELADRGYLAQFDIIELNAELTPEEEEEYNKLLKEYRIHAQGRNVQQLVKDLRNGDTKAENAMIILNKMKRLIANSKNKMSILDDIVKKERGNKMIIFTQYVDQAEEIGKRYNAKVLTGKTDKETREKILNDFRKAKQDILVLTTVGDEGLDIQDATVGAMFSGTGSKRQYTQRLGRLLRPGNGKKAKLYEIVVKGTREEDWARRRRENISSKHIKKW